MLITEYKPKSLDDLVLPNSVLDQFKEGLNNNYLFHSSPGTGKTSTAFAISKQFKYETLYINASLDSSVENIKSTIVPFCETAPIGSLSKKKLVILDEVDGISLQSKKALRGVMNDYSDKAHFILTCNSIKGDEFFRAIKSRCITIDFSFPDLDAKEKNSYLIDLVKRILFICEKENIKIDKKVAYNLIVRNFPDFRKTIQTLSSLIDSGHKEITEELLNKSSSEDTMELFDLVLSEVNPMQIHKIIYSDYRTKVEDSFEQLHTSFFEFLNENKPEYTKYFKQMAITIAKWDSTKDTLTLPVHALKACIFDLQTILNS